MPVFYYTARDANAQIKDGTIDAVDLPSAKEVLRLMGMQPITIEIESVQRQSEQPAAPVVSPPVHYVPFVDTLRLYAGWLLAGYTVAYVIGYYALTKPLSFEVPYVFAFLYSQIILSFALVSFLFLLGTSVHTRLRRGYISALPITILSIGVFILYRLNV